MPLVLDLIDALLDAREAPGLVERVRRGVALWIDSDGQMPLERYLGLQTPAKARQALRDVHLREAAALIRAGTLWLKASELARAAKEFELRKWPQWRRLDAAPAHATAIEQQLFKAMKVCGQMPHTGERMRKIIDLAANQLEADTLLDARED